MFFGGDGCMLFGGGPDGGFGPCAGARLDDAVALLGSGAYASPLNNCSSILDLSFASSLPLCLPAANPSEVVQKVVSVPERELDLMTLLRFWDLARVRHLWTRHVLQFLPST